MTSLSWPKDITKQDIQSFLLQYYSSQNAPAHQSLYSRSNRCSPDTNSQKSSTLSYPQSVVSTVMKGFASTPTTNRGLLVWHSVGSGKTTSAVAVMDAFWDSPHKNIVFATSVDASNSNPPSIFYKNGQRFFSRFRGKSLEEVKKAFDARGVKFFTFATLAHYLLIANPLKRVKKDADVESHKAFLKDAVLIIDEVHNIFKPLPNQKLENTALKDFLMNDNDSLTKDLKIVILTATPGDSSRDVIDLLNMIRDRTQPPLEELDFKRANPSQLEDFKDKIRGLISYFDMSNDFSRFPRIIQERPTKVPMSHRQYIKYVETYNEEPDTLRNANTLMKGNQLGSYYKHARRYSNMLYDLDKDMLINEFSAKLPILLDTIKRYPTEKHYVYSSFYEHRGYGGHGINAIAKALEAEMSYEKMTVGRAQEIPKTSLSDSLPIKPRYVLAISSELAEDKEKLRALTDVFNRPENARGSYVHVFLASQGYNEGVDLKDVRHIHIFEPLLTAAADKQTIGRAARFCSHSDLDRERGEWTVRVHRYISEQPADLSMFNLNYIRDRSTYLRGEVDKLKIRYDDLKVSTDQSVKDLRQNIGKEIQTYEMQLVDLGKKYKLVDKMNLRNVKMIDDQITKEALARAHEMMVLYDIMKSAAIDHLLYASSL